MEALLRLINHSVNNSLRGVFRLTDIFVNPMGWEKSLIPLQATQRLPIPTYSDSDVANNEEDGKWSGFLWAAPKKRTSQMKRLRRRFGHPDWGSPLLKPKTDLRICETCGHHYQAKHLCGNCYERVKKETEAIRAKAEVEIGHGPEDKRIVVLYEQESLEHQGAEMSKKDQIIVEIPKPRPSWFSSNLLQRSTLRVNRDATAMTPTPPVPKISRVKGGVKD